MNADDTEKLKRCLSEIDHALTEVEDSLKTGLASDSKSAVFSFSECAKGLALSDDALGEKIAATAGDAWVSIAVPRDIRLRMGQTLLILKKARHLVLENL
jgi:hypothetical protein